ncbi:hypothetical protein [Aquirhabdus sp.]|uniref:hypothetical protein n=1 Tax=Aquirhabdus sp. TaxID=2824160 RepID=UPI00396C9963
MQSNIIKYCYIVIRLEDEKLTVAEKYLLLRVLLMYGLEPVEGSANKLVKGMGLTVSQIRKSRNELLELGYLERRRIEPLVEDHAGKSLEGFAFSESHEHFKNQRNLSAWELYLWGSWIQPILIQPKRTRDNNHPQKELLYSTRVLLAVLYAQADELGVISNMGTSRLLKLTGMGKDGLKAQLENISKLGYLMVRVAGMMESNILKNFSGDFYLNVYDFYPSADHTPCTLVSFNSAMTDRYNTTFGGKMIVDHNKPNQSQRVQIVEQNDSALLWKIEVDEESLAKIRKEELDKLNELKQSYENAKQAFSAKRIFGGNFQGNIRENARRILVGIKSDESWGWLAFFKDFDLGMFLQSPKPLVFAKTLEFKVYHYASVLLSQHWAGIDLDIDLEDKIQPTILEKIKQDLFLKHDFDPDNTTFEHQIEEQKINALCLLLYRNAFELALIGKAMVLVTADNYSISTNLLQDGQYRIVPFDLSMSMKDQHKRFMIAFRLNHTSCAPSLSSCVFIKPVLDSTRHFDLDVRSKEKTGNAQWPVGERQTFERFGFFQTKSINYI